MIRVTFGMFLGAIIIGCIVMIAPGTTLTHWTGTGWAWIGTHASGAGNAGNAEHTSTPPTATPSPSPAPTTSYPATASHS